MTPYERDGMNPDIARAVADAMALNDWDRLRALAGKACILGLIRAAS